MRWAAACVIAALMAFGGQAEAAVACGKVSACSEASTPLGGAEQIFINQGGVTKKTTVGSVLGFPPSVANNAALVATQGTASRTLYRSGFTTPGDGGGAIYTWSSTACTINSGNGDNGSQVKPTAGGCWNADFSGMTPTPLIWGAAGNGTTDDTAAFQAAVSALANQTVNLGKHQYKISSVADSAGPIRIVGEGRYTGFGLKAATSGVTMLTLAQHGSGIYQADIDCSIQTAGTCILLDVPCSGGNTGASAETLYLTGGCVGIDLERLYPTVRHVRADGFHGAGCADYMVGRSTTAGGTFTPILEDFEAFACYTAFPDRLAINGIAG